MDAKRKPILDRIKYHEEAITKAREYLQTGQHADWRGFRPLFDRKFRDGKPLPPHKDWVKNVYLRRHERSLAAAEKLLQRLTDEADKRTLDAALADCEKNPAIGSSWADVKAGIQAKLR